ncbi:pyridoxal phosphate-dependent transferase [Suillus fuscotomentosus]|uniref:Pyridoxal phosphate-dependent transferase n=1 Tax=Suillus fuscotomentosus TaxID=1912939 RepID=A0AAD4HLU1_9AGAM|nr:pyridoxal phosphate-dependent transferase [Suillus fuscotomentosus]KAG1900911.1 pyridoxal phosphate-dependent transferase [Suillus fuscotomentosus]
MNAEQAGYQAIDRICDYHVTLRDRPVLSQVEPGYLRKALPSSAPTEGEDFQLIADDYQKYIIPGLTHWQHPSFFAYFPTSSTFEGILAELYASSTSNPGFNWSVSPACTELEAVIMDWMAQLLGLDESFYNISEVGGGVIQTSASDSVLVATVAARSRYIREHPQVAMENLVLYTTTQTHSLGKKAGLILGLKVRALGVTAQDDFALRGDTLKVALEEDTNAGFHPFILIGTVGTTSSGAVDRLDEIADVAKHYPFLWLHVDAAWAGVAFVCPEYREAYQLPAINSYVDSFCTSFYKWGLIQFDGSCLWVRHRKHLTDALDITPEFLRSKHGNAGTAIDYRNWQLGLGKRFRSLKFWFVLRARGVKGFQKYISDCIKLNTKFAQSIYESELFSVVTKPSLAMTVFRLAPKSLCQLRTPELNTLNRAFYARLAARNDIAITQTDLNGVFCIRMVIGAEQTLESDVERVLALMEYEAMALLKNQWEGIGGRRGRKTDVVPFHSH